MLTKIDYSYLLSNEFFIYFHLIFFIIQFIIWKHNITWNYAKNVAVIINAIYSVLSGSFCVYTIYLCYTTVNWSEILQNGQITYISTDFEWLLRIFYLSKFWETIDIILVSLMGYPIDWYFRVHHNTTPLLGYVLYRYHPMSGYVFMILNTFMHFWVYMYFAGCQHFVIFHIIRVVGHIQLVVSLLACLSGLNYYIFVREAYTHHDSFYNYCADSKDPLLSEAVPALLYSIYFLLFRMQVLDEDRQKKLSEKFD